MARGNVKMDFWIWSADGYYYRERKPGDTSKEEEWPSHLKYDCAIGSMTKLQKNLEDIKQKQPTGYAVGYSYSVGGVKPCWDKHKRNAVRMDRIIFADINLASDELDLGALFNKWSRLTESFFNGGLGADVKCITFRPRDISTKIFVWTTKGLSDEALRRIRNKCDDITNRCEQKIRLNWCPEYL